MNKMILGLVTFVGTVIIFISIMAAYYWFLPLGVGLDLVVGYIYIKERKASKQIIAQ